jgi:hypothetical protein
MYNLWYLFWSFLFVCLMIGIAGAVLIGMFNLFLWLI